jgi:electron transfer flavoprotein alpha subunit
MKILVIIEASGEIINGASLAAVSAAKQMILPPTPALPRKGGGSDGVHIDLLLCAPNDALAERVAKIAGISKVLVAVGAQFEYLQAEDLADILANIASEYTHILMAATTTGKDCLPYASAKFDSQQISEITQVLAPDIFVRPIYAGNAYEQVQSNDAIKFITVRATAFEKAQMQGGNAEIIKIPLPLREGVGGGVSINKSLLQVLELQQSTSARPDLGAAKVVVAGGRGVASAANFALIELLADKLGAAIGASRAAVDAGYVPNEYQVGQTGRVVAPDLYIAVGISGAIQHLAGMKDSKVIVAINKDENAPIFNIADYGLVGDLFQIVPELIAKM